MGRRDNAFTYDDAGNTTEQQIDAFRKRQQRDIRRFDLDSHEIQHRTLDAETSQDGAKLRGHEWRDADGERLDDFGVDEEVDFYEDNVPLSELIRRRKDHSL